VADLRRDAVRATYQLSAEHDAGADAGADGEHHHGLFGVGRRAVAELRPGRHVSVVLHHYRQGDGVLDVALQRFVAPGEIGGEKHCGTGGVDPPGGSDAYRVSLVGFSKFAYDFNDHVPGRGNVAGWGFAPGGGDDGPVRVDHPAEHLRAADVHADGESHGGVLPC
jgi:hypothetical protein